jgi:hypothetical protein
MDDSSVTVGVAADISNFTDGMAQASAAADETFGHVRAIARGFSADLHNFNANLTPALNR